MKNKWRVYLQPFDDFGNYSGEYIEVTDDLKNNGLGAINQDLDNTEYDIGVYRVSNFTIALRNDHGRYSDVDEVATIFKYKRAESLVKITWEIEDGGPLLGEAESGSGFMSEETVIFIGLLNDENLVMNVEDQDIKFTCLGRESVFKSTVVPFGTVSNGQLFSVVLYNLLNQSRITDLLTVSQANIVCGLDQTIDSIASLQNKTVQEGLNKLLLASNSVLTIRDNAIYVSPREPSATVKFTFYGQGATAGPENIQKLYDIKKGLNRTFNYFTWQNTTLVAEDTSSTALYGARKKEVTFEFVTDNTKRQNILQNLLDEFTNPMQEFTIETPISYDSIVAGLLDKVIVDYPRVYLSTQNLPLCGIAVLGEDILPKALFSFQIPTTDFYKVIGKSINANEAMIRFKLRKIG